MAHQVRRYAPLREERALFKEFAAIESAADVLRFANQYGALGGDAEVLIDLPFNQASALVSVGELLDTWVSEAATMRELISLWEMATDGRKAALGEFIWWTRNTVEYRSGRSRSVIAHSTLTRDLFRQLRPDEPVPPAFEYLRRAINEHLKGRASPRLISSVEPTRLRLSIVPSSLIGALWLQFSLAVDGDKTYRVCACGQWFEVSPEVKRADAKFCSDPCRKRAHRMKSSGSVPRTVEGAKRASATQTSSDQND